MIYEPREDSYLILKHIKDYAKEKGKDKDKKILDLGTGSGILALEALKYSKNVLASDINKEAVDYVKSLSQKLRAIQSDLFSHIKGKFDLILFNPPYLPEEKAEMKRLMGKELTLITTGGKKGYEIIERFFSEVKIHLKKNGEIIIIFSSLTNKKKVDKIIKKYGFKFKLIDSEKLFFEELYVYLVSLNWFSKLIFYLNNIYKTKKVNNLNEWQAC